MALVASLSLSGCSAPTEVEKVEVKSEKSIAIENVCKYVSKQGISDIYGTRIALAKLVHVDGAYMPVLEEMADFFTVMRERSTYPKKYPDLQLLKSFCSSFTE